MKLYIVFIELDSSVFYLENCLTSLRVSNTFVVYSRVLSFILFFVFCFLLLNVDVALIAFAFPDSEMFFNFFISTFP